MPGPTAGPGTFVINALHEDVPFDAAMRADVEAEVAHLAGWLGLELCWDRR